MEPGTKRMKDLLLLFALGFVLSNLCIAGKPINNSAFRTERHIAKEPMGNKTVSYAGVTFSYSNNWEIEMEEYEGGLYRIYCEKQGISASETFSIVWASVEIDPIEWIQGTIEEIKSEPAFKNVNTKSIKSYRFKNYDAFSMDYYGKIFDEKYYGRIISFKDGKKSVLIIKYSDSEYKIDTEFGVIENSLKIE